MLGDAIAESGGRRRSSREVEALRRATIAFRGVPTRRAASASSAFVDGLDLAQAEDVIRAFTCYFQLVNLAEERQRVRAAARAEPARASR